MRAASQNVVLTALQDLIARLDHGARLPTVRELMHIHRVSQATVQEALNQLRSSGLLTAQVGRGTYVVKDGGSISKVSGEHRSRPVPFDRLESVLILSNASLNERCMLVQNQIVEELSRSDSKVVQISYHNTSHLLEILTSIPNFDAAILQSHYESIPIRLLSLLQGKARALVVDGHTVSGVDIDRVGTDWEEALDMALTHLGALGHRSVALVSLDTMAQPILAVRRAFVRSGSRKEGFSTTTLTLGGVQNPTHAAGEALRQALTSVMDDNGRLPFSAMITLGLSDSFGIARSLDDLGIGWPQDLSVFILGHHDAPTEHFGTMSIAGSSYLQGARQLVEVIHRRLQDPKCAPQIVYLDCTATFRSSTGAQEA